MTEPLPKTYKREAAGVLLIALVGVMGLAAWEDPIECLKVIVWPVLSFAAIAMGMQWASTQTDLVGEK